MIDIFLLIVLYQYRLQALAFDQMAVFLVKDKTRSRLAFTAFFVY